MTDADIYCKLLIIMPLILATVPRPHQAAEEEVFVVAETSLLRRIKRTMDEEGKGNSREIRSTNKICANTGVRQTQTFSRITPRQLAAPNP